MWLRDDDRYEVWAMLLSCGHIQWWVELPAITVDQAASMRVNRALCWPCRTRLDGFWRMPKRAVYTLRPAYHTWQERIEAAIAGHIPREPRWR